MDSILCLESEIRKAQTNKEMVIAAMFDIEKAYDMLWKEGLLIKLEAMGIEGRMFNWIMDFFQGRVVEVKVKEYHSRMYPVENGTPQGSACSPILFNIMINDVFAQVDRSIGKSLYADDGALWVRGRNLAYMQGKMQKAIQAVEQWANKWGFKMSVAKTQVICFSKRHKPVSLKLYDQILEQVSVVRFLGVWFDEKLTWGQHIGKVKTKCKKINNLLRCLSGQDWGASRTALRNIYWALMRAALDYGCLAYMSAAECHLRKLEVEQAMALRICCGAFRTSPTAAVQVEMGEMPLRLRRIKLMLSYWVSLQGHNDMHPGKAVLLDCAEHTKSNFMSFGWVCNNRAKSAGLQNIQYCLRGTYTFPPWSVVPTEVDMRLRGEIEKRPRQVSVPFVVQRYLERKCVNKVMVFTDGSKDPKTGRTGAAVYIPEERVTIKKRTTDELAVYTTELIAIMVSLEWVKTNGRRSSVVASDSMAALASIKSGKSCRQDILCRIYSIIYELDWEDIQVSFIWVPAHMGVDGNEGADALAKQALKSQYIQLDVALSKSEAKSIIKNHMHITWQEVWDFLDTGRHLYNIQKQVSGGRRVSRRRREEAIITRLRIGHTGLNKTLNMIGKHQTGKCECCGELESVEHVLLLCAAYEEERKKIKEAAKQARVCFSLESILNESSKMYGRVLVFLRETGLERRI